MLDSVAAVLLLAFAPPDIARDEPAVAERPIKARQWIAQLGHASYAVRERATRGLIEGRAEVIGPLLEQADFSDPEVAQRAARVLHRLTASDDADEILRAVEALERLQRHESPAIARRAAQSLADARQRFLRGLETYGGKVQQHKDAGGRETTRITLYGWTSGTPVLYLRDFQAIELVLAGGHVSDRNLRQLHGLTSVRSLDLRYTPLGDAGLDGVSAMENIETLYLSRTKVTDAALDEIAKLAKLETLYLSDTEVTDAGLEKLLAAKSLRLLIVRGTKTTNAGIERLTRERPGVKVVSGS